MCSIRLEFLMNIWAILTKYYPYLYYYYLEVGNRTDSVTRRQMVRRKERKGKERKQSRSEGSSEDPTDKIPTVGYITYGYTCALPKLQQ